MTIKEMLKSICLECERYKGKIQVACPFRSISNEYCDEYETIKKDLEVLNILKKHIYSSDSSISIILDDLRNYDDFQKIKEWLENEQINKEKQFNY